MKLIYSSLVGLVTYAVQAQLSEDQIRSLPPEWVLGVYSNMIDTTSTSSFEKAYARGLVGKMKASGYVPEEVLQAVINYMMYGAAGLERSVFCPQGQCDVPISLTQIWGYGCYCNFGDDLGKGSGEPVDAFDEKCRTLQRCMKCVQMDADDGGYTCDGNVTPYNANFMWWSASLVADCETSNNGDCPTHLCACETKLIADVMEILWDKSAQVNAGFRHDGGFDKTQCIGINNFDTNTGGGDTNTNNNNQNNGPIPGTNGGSDPVPAPQCCGYYPNRAPMSDIQDCCDHRNPFNTITESCCNGAVVEGFSC